MFELKHKLHEILNMVKGFTAGYTTSNIDSILMSYEDKVYKVTLTEVDKGEVTHDLIKNHLYPNQVKEIDMLFEQIYKGMKG